MILITVDTVEDYISEILKIQKAWEKPSGYLWCRGTSNIEHKLKPGFFWQKISCETTLVTEFLINYKQIVEHHNDNSWELYYLMQHYELPTRLLDWTKSPLNALFFALSNPKSIDDAVYIWVMQPEFLNQHTISQEAIITPYKERSKNNFNEFNYLPEKLRANDNPIPSKPIAIEPLLCNRRIISQQGCFTIHGTEANPIDYYFPSDDLHLYQIKFKLTNGSNRVLSQLRTLGIKEEIIWQDLSP